MKRIISILIVLVMLVSLFPEAMAEEESIDVLKQRIEELEAEIAEKDALIKDLRAENEELKKILNSTITGTVDDVGSQLVQSKWININDEDEYLFFDDGTGKHNEVSIRYIIENDNVMITEGVSSVQAKAFYWDEFEGVLRLIPENENTFYVQENAFEKISALVKQETASILVSQNLWKCTATKTLTVYKFYDGGMAALAVPGETMMLSWELIDGNTARLELIRNGEKQISYLDIVNNDGNYTLVSKDGTVIWVPYDG